MERGGGGGGAAERERKSTAWKEEEAEEGKGEVAGGVSPDYNPGNDRNRGRRWCGRQRREHTQGNCTQVASEMKGRTVSWGEEEERFKSERFRVLAVSQETRRRRCACRVWLDSTAVTAQWRPLSCMCVANSHRSSPQLKPQHHQTERRPRRAMLRAWSQHKSCCWTPCLRWRWVPTAHKHNPELLATVNILLSFCCFAPLLLPVTPPTGTWLQVNWRPSIARQ